MIQQNYNPSDEVDPTKKQQENEDTEDYDILPSNGPGLAGDDGEQVVSEGEVVEEDDDDDDDDDEEDDD